MIFIFNDNLLFDILLYTFFSDNLFPKNDNLLSDILLSFFFSDNLLYDNLIMITYYTIT